MLSRNQTVLSFALQVLRMEFFHRVTSSPKHLGILPGTFNPVTLAHLSLAHAALPLVDEILFVLPKIFPHKEYSGATFDKRIRILQAATAGAGPFSTASSEGGLFLDIARECRQAYGEAIQLSFLCGCDAADRIINWNYDDPNTCASMLREFHLLVAARRGEYQPPPEFAHAIHRLEIGTAWNTVSATDVRRRIGCGEPWEHLVPSAAHDLVRQAYAAAGSGEALRQATEKIRLPH